MTGRPDVRVAEKVALTPAEAGALIGLSDAQVRRMVARGDLAPVPHCSPLRIARTELDRWATRPALAFVPTTKGA